MALTLRGQLTTPVVEAYDTIEEAVSRAVDLVVQSGAGTVTIQGAGFQVTVNEFPQGGRR